MGTDKEIIVALEFGTSAIRGIAGCRRADGAFQVLDIEQEKVVDTIQRGVIYNIDKTTQAITHIFSQMSSNLGVHIDRAYVGIGGQSLTSKVNTITRGFETKVKITPELIDNLMDNNRSATYPDCQILDVIPQEYVVGNRTIADPIGIPTEQIEARFVNIVARETVIENIQKCMRAAGVDIAEFFISPLLLADAMLSDTEKRSGCALIDFGAGTTTVSVFTSNLLRHLSVVPLGGNSITNDLAVVRQMEFDEAEVLKRKHGIAYVPAESDNPQMIPISLDRVLNENDLQNIIGARIEEIIVNAWAQIEEYKDQLLSGIVVTGGGAQMKDIAEAIKHHTNCTKVKLSKSLITAIDVAESVVAPQGGSIDTLIALLMHGEMNCVSDPVEPAPEAQPTETSETVEVGAEVPLTETDSIRGKDKNDDEDSVPTFGRWKNFIKKLGDMFTEESESDDEG